MNSSRQRPGLLFTLVGPAGAGKNRLMNHVTALTSLRQFPTATTRPMRPGEQEGREHLFVSTEDFERMIAQNELLEHQVIHGNFYGMPRATIEAAFDSGRSLIADIEVLGAERARQAYPDNVVSLFIEPPTLGSLIDRMHERGENEPEIAKRLLRVPMELAYAHQCDYVICNDLFEHAADLLYQIVIAELRGDHLTVMGDTLTDFQFSYEIKVAPVYHDQALVRDRAVPLGEDQLPHETALQTLRRELGLLPHESALIGGGETDGKYRPPMRLDYTEDDQGEHFTYVYLYRLAERIAAPAGWSWQPLEAFQAATPERQSEA